MTRALRVGLGLVVLVLSMGALRLMLGSWASSMLYPVPAFPVPETPPPPLVDASFELDGHHVSAWTLEGTSELDVLWLHGNGENLGTMARSGLFERFAALGHSLTVLDYPGYGRSAGRPSQERIVETALAVFDRRAALEPERRRIVVGWSLGAAVAAQVTSQRAQEIAGVALLSPWADLHTLAARHFPGWLVRLALRDSWDSVEAVGTLAAESFPVLMLHGVEDRLIPITEGRRLREALPRSRWIEVPQVGHNDLPSSPHVWEALTRFLDESVSRGEDLRRGVETENEEDVA